MDWKLLKLPADASLLLTSAPSVTFAENIEQLIDIACGGPGSNSFEVAYDVPGYGRVVEAQVVRVRNGVSANYLDPYMRRRDPDCLVIGDDSPSDKPRFRDSFDTEFDSLRCQTFDWLSKQDLVCFFFTAGQPDMGIDALAIVPANASFFALGLAMLQGLIAPQDLPASFAPKAVIYTAPVFRLTHFGGRQFVVHNRTPDFYEMFSYNLYPGPSAKKGVFGMLLDLGEREGWVTAHCSTVKVMTPYDNDVTIMHEGASGGGKSEMLEQAHRQDDGRWAFAKNTITGEERYLELPRTCALYPVADDMAMCHPSLQNGNGKLRLVDAEKAWFLRVNHITTYGTDPYLERLTAVPGAPLLFLNIDAVPGSRALIWEHIEDQPGKSCPNPRVVVPRTIVPNIVHEPVTVDIRSFGVRTPPCTRETPSYGIIGLFHLLPPALAWLWRLVSPRGYDNPSILSDNGMSSEGVGSYWPFVSGLRVTQANALLEQFDSFRRMRYILCPNQYIGAWKVDFYPQWIAREYLARRGSSRFQPQQIRPSRCSLLGYAMHQIQVEGQQIARWFLQVDTQPEVGAEAYDQGAKMLEDFFRDCLKDYLVSDLAPLGREIIECCMRGGSLEDYERLIPMY
ncbi:MAG: DUF4914 family protein [Chloroflexota bacterium]|nr:MAG: DUF4914 family protein [Chloroflexota bacterium]